MNGVSTFGDTYFFLLNLGTGNPDSLNPVSETDMIESTDVVPWKSILSQIHRGSQPSRLGVEPIWDPFSYDSRLQFCFVFYPKP